MEKKIIGILVQDIGPVTPSERDVYIEKFTKTDGMAVTDWYRLENKEYNGKYVIEITYADIEYQEAP